MRKFSERHAIIEPREAIQRGAIDDRLRNRIWSQMDQFFWKPFGEWVKHSSFATFVLREIQDDFFGQRTDDLRPAVSDNIESFRKWYQMEAKWNEIYDLVQFLADLSKVSGSEEPYATVRTQGFKFMVSCGKILEVEKSAYRFIQGNLSEVTDEVEIASIEQTLSAPNKFASVRSHLSAALAYYSDRVTPDYRNSIKESISALESTFYCLNGTRSNNLVNALDAAEKQGLVIHKALKTGILNIYGWTSNEAGIRHGLIEGDAAVSEAEAKLMLVLCSGLINFLILKSLP